MAQDKFKRKLTKIFSADVAGYSRLMGEVVDSPGDNLLAEFTKVKR